GGGGPGRGGRALQPAGAGGGAALLPARPQRHPARLGLDDEGLDGAPGGRVQHPPHGPGVRGARLPARPSGGRPARARGLRRRPAAWRGRVHEAGGGVRLRSSVSAPPDLRVGASVPVTVWATLGALSPEEVAVEVAYGPPNGAGEPNHAGLILATHAGRDGDEERFEAEVPCRTSGRLACAVRVRPRNPDTVNPLTPLLLTWE